MMCRLQEIAEDIRSCHLVPQPESQYRMVDPASVSPSLLQIKAEADLRSPAHHNNILNTPPKEEFDVDLSSMQVNKYHTIIYISNAMRRTNRLAAF